MALKITNTQNYEDIADAIRDTYQTIDTFTPSQMAGVINSYFIELTEGIRFPAMQYGSGSTLDLSVCKITNLTSANDMFKGVNLQSGTTLDISNFDFSNLTSWTNMFGDNYTGVGNTCNVLVKDQDAKDWINTNFSRLTRVRIK